MDTLRTVLTFLVALIGMTVWCVFIPQIKELLTVKKAGSVSVESYWLSLGMQAVLLAYLLIQPKVDWKLSLNYAFCVICHVVIIFLVYYYRKWPGGR